MQIEKNTIPTKLLWVDLEMTGLDPQKDRILEVAAEVTDFQFNLLGSYKAIVLQPDEVLDASNEFTKNQAAGNGFFELVRTQGKAEADVVRELVEFIKSQFGVEPAVLAGNSIHQDRRFIKQWWPEVDELLHYRMLDVSSWKVFMQGRYDVQFEKKEAHRALDDIHESVDELQYYLEWFKTNGRD